MFSQCGAAVAFASFRTARLIWQDGGYGFTSFGTVYFAAVRSHVFTSFRLELCHWSDSYGVDSLIVSNCFREGWCLRLLFLYGFPVWLARVSLRHFVSVGIRSQQPTRAHFL